MSTPKTPQERSAAVQAVRAGQSVASAAKAAGVSVSALRGWLKASPVNPFEAEVLSLRAEVAQLRTAQTGSVTPSVQAHVDALRREQQLDTHGAALAELALALAAQLDDGGTFEDGGRHMAAWARELRQTLEAITPKGADDDGDDDSWLDDLPSEVRNPPQP